jgi:predicted transporter
VGAPLKHPNRIPMNNGKRPHILSNSSNLLGICFIIIAGLKLSKMSIATYADEISMVAAIGFMTSCVLSYMSIRSDKSAETMERFADYFFLFGLFTLFTAVLIFSLDVL